MHTHFLFWKHLPVNGSLPSSRRFLPFPTSISPVSVTLPDFYSNLNVFLSIFIGRFLNKIKIVLILSNECGSFLQQRRKTRTTWRIWRHGPPTSHCCYSIPSTGGKEELCVSGRKSLNKWRLKKKTRQPFAYCQAQPPKEGQWHVVPSTTENPKSLERPNSVFL